MGLNLVGAEAVSNNNASVTLVAAPASGVRRIVLIARLNNRDTAAVDARIQHAKGVTDRVVASNAALPVGDTVVARNVVLDANDESLEIILGAAVATNQLDGTATYYDELT